MSAVSSLCNCHQWDQVSGTYQLVSGDHGAPAASLSKTPLMPPHPVCWVLKLQKGLSLPNCGLSCVPPTFCCPTLRLIMRPTGGASRAEAGADRGAEPGDRCRRGSWRSRIFFPEEASFLSWRGTTHRTLGSGRYDPGPRSRLWSRPMTRAWITAQRSYITQAEMLHGWTTHDPASAFG